MCPKQVILHQWANVEYCKREPDTVFLQKNLRWHIKQSKEGDKEKYSQKTSPRQAWFQWQLLIQDIPSTRSAYIDKNGLALMLVFKVWTLIAILALEEASSGMEVYTMCIEERNMKI